MVILSVLLPAYNEARILPDSLARLAAYLDASASAAGLAPWEIVVVDDGSRDRTAASALEAAAREPRIRLVEHPANLGKGAALATAIREARGELLVATDVDLSYALSDLLTVAHRLREADASGGRPAMVAGDRRHPESRMDLLMAALVHVARRQALSWAFGRCVRTIFGLPFRDTQCGLKGFTRSAAVPMVARLRTRRFLSDIELFVIARQNGLPVATVPVHLTYLSGESTVRVARELLPVLRDLFRIRLAQALGRYRFNAGAGSSGGQDRESRGT